MSNLEMIMDKNMNLNEENKCFYIFNCGAHFRDINEEVKSINGFYNGSGGWYVKSRHKEAVFKICQAFNVHCMELLLSSTFECLKKQHNAFYYNGKAIKIRFEMDTYCELLKLPRSKINEILNDEQHIEQLALAGTPEGKRLLQLKDEYDAILERIKETNQEYYLDCLNYPPSDTS